MFLKQICIFVFRDEGGFSQQLLSKRYKMTRCLCTSAVNQFTSHNILPLYAITQHINVEPRRWCSRLMPWPRNRYVGFESQPRQTQFLKPGSDSSTVNARQFLGNNHYKRMPRVTVGVAR